MRKFTNKATRQTRPEVTKLPAAKPWVFPLMVHCGLMLLVICSAFLTRVYFNQASEKLIQEANLIRIQTEEKEREIRNMIAKRERMYSLRHIKQKIDEYHLALRPTVNSQIRYLQPCDAGNMPYGRTQLARTRKTGELNRYQAANSR